MIQAFLYKHGLSTYFCNQFTIMKPRLKTVAAIMNCAIKN